MKRLLFFYLLIITCTLHSQPVSVIDIPTIDKLPVNAIHKPFQDSEGYVWYGTVDGLCRDDGYDIRVFRSDINTPGLLKNNAVGCIAESVTGNIWFGTDKGAYVLDKSDYSVHVLDEKVIGERRIDNIFSTMDGSMWISCYSVLFKYNEEEKLLDSIPVKYQGKDDYISGFGENAKNEIFVTISGRQIFRLDVDNRRFIPYAQKNNSSFTNMVYDKERNVFWVGMWLKDGLVQFNPDAADENYYTYYKCFPENNHIRLYDFVLDEVYGDVWILSESELRRYSIDDSNKRLVFDSQQKLPDRSMMAMMFSRGDKIWVTAFDRPSFLVHLKETFTHSYELPALKNGLEGNPAIMCLCHDRGSLFWIMQERSGLYLYNLDTNEIKSYREYPQLKRMPLHSGREMTKSKMYEGIWFVPDLSKDFYSISFRNGKMNLEDRQSLAKVLSATDYITQLYEDQQGFLWVGSTKGVCVYDIKNRKIIKCFEEIGHVTDILQDWNGVIWICTMDKGMYQSLQDWEIRSMKEKEPLNYSCMSIGPDGNLWFGTIEGGVYSYNPENATWEDYNRMCCLNGDQINQIVVDKYNHVWIGANQKLMEVNTKNGAMQTYLTSDETIGLHRFLPTAVTVTENGDIFWGGIPGLFKVSPSNLLDRNSSSVVTKITEIRIMGRALALNAKDEERAFAEIDITPDDKNLNISFSTLNHRYASKIRYAYRLLGLEEDWHYTAIGENKAVYTNLNKGNYIFEVKATDENGVWSNKVTSLIVHRLPAFYESIWAYLLYFLLISIVLAYVFIRYIKRIERKNEEMWKDSEEMVEMKRFLDSKITAPNYEYENLDRILLDKAIKIVEANLSDLDFDVNALSDAMCMSRSTFTRKIKAITEPVNLL